MDYQIFMDVSGDVDPVLAKEENIGCVPMQYTVGEEMHTSYGPETREFMKVFYDGQRNGDLTQTTQITPFNYTEFFTPYLKKGIDCLYICLSSGLSSTYQSALLAASELGDDFPDARLVVLDSRSATAGIGLVLERAVKNKKAGLTIDENFVALEETVKKLKIKFMVQNLTYLRRGGRVGAAAATVANVLDIKPILEINEEGKLVTINKKRGNKQTLNTLLQYFEDERSFEDNGDPIYIVDSDSPEFSDYLYDEVRKRCPNHEIKRTSLSPIIGAHTGPGLGAVCHIGK